MTNSMKDETGVVFDHKEQMTGKELFVLDVLFEEIERRELQEGMELVFDMPDVVKKEAASYKDGVFRLYKPKAQEVFSGGAHPSVRALVYAPTSYGTKRLIAYWSEEFVLGQTFEGWTGSARNKKAWEFTNGLRKKRADLDAFETRMQNVLDEMENGQLYHPIPF